MCLEISSWTAIGLRQPSSVSAPQWGAALQETRSSRTLVGRAILVRELFTTSRACGSALGLGWHLPPLATISWLVLCHRCRTSEHCIRGEPAWCLPFVSACARVVRNRTRVNLRARAASTTLTWHSDGAEVSYGMARSVPVCALTGLMFVQLISPGCSPSTGSGVTIPGGGNKGTGGTGSAVGGGGNKSGQTGGVSFQITVTPDKLQQLLITCGNGQADNEDEQCDDGNKEGGDGCTKTCQYENPLEWDCPRTGACTSSAVCGNGSLSSLEACDDGNTDDGDGCSADCKTIEEGWQCRMPNKPCTPKCGDSMIVAGETCDDGNRDNEDGCSITCTTEPGYSCDGTGPGSCKQSVCGDSKKDHSEACDCGDDPNNLPDGCAGPNGLFFGDGTGCSKTCTREPVCKRNDTAGCASVCGDGNLSGDEVCDDGNTFDGDGCSADCSRKEDGFQCEDVTISDAQECPSNTSLDCLVLPVVYRDFEGQNVSGGHPDFFYMGAPVTGGRTVGVTPGANKTTCMPNAYGTALTFTSGGQCPANDQSGPCTGLVGDTLDSEGKPTMAKQKCHCVFTDWDNTGILGTCSGATCSGGITGAQVCWVDGSGDNHYRIEGDVNVFQSADSFKQWYRDSDFSNKVLGTLELAKTTGNLYQFSSSRPGDPAGSPSRVRSDDLHDACLASNRSATLDTGFFPLEDESATKLCNITSYWMTSVANATDATCCAGQGCTVKAQWDPLASWDNCPTEGTGGMVPRSDGVGGKITGRKRNFYFTSEVRYLFRYDGKNATLQFNGDDDVWAFINGQLAIDLGGTHERAAQSVTINASTYKLTSGNTYEIAVFQAERGPVESNYQLTLSGFSTMRTQCGAQCGDGKITGGEECDLGKELNTGEYGGCNEDCTYGPFCGDGEKNGDEECDNGNSNGATYGKEGCTSACTTPHFCGDSFIDGLNGEECDSGSSASDTCQECKLVIGIN